MSTVITGAAFGAALVSAGVTDPAVIISQFKFVNFDMIQAFLAATATTTLAVAALDKLGYVKLNPRSASPLGLLSRHDGNILGGALLGAGMALSASCPGTAIAHAALGLRTGWYALAGATVGGILYTTAVAPAIAARRRRALAAQTADNDKTKDENKSKASSPPLAVHETLGAPRTATVLALEAAYVAVIAATINLAGPSPYKSLVAPALGGVLIGASSLLSLLLRKSLIGVSSVYEDIGKYVSWLLRGAPGAIPKAYTSSVFAASIAAGVYALRLRYPEVVPLPDPRVTDFNAALGGFLFALGARIAGGCTSGHGISGISLLSISSFITIASTFAAAGAVALSVY